MEKKILAITGIRSEYDILYPVINRLRDNNEVELKVVISSAHLSDWHGYTAKKIETDGFEVADKIDCLYMTNRNTQRAKGMGTLTYALSQTVERVQPDFLLVVGDREESIATAIVGNYMEVLVCHIGGGDPVYGNADDPIRFAVSKLAHVHFTTNQNYANNLKKIGEEEFRIFNTGNPSLDNIHNEKQLDMHAISQYLNISLESKKYIVVIKHPLSSAVELSYDHMKVTLNAINEFIAINPDYKAIGIYPNTDPGSYDIVKVIEENNNDKICFFKTLPRDIFVNLLRNASVLVGNSSLGILEAPFYELPVINIGERQRGRLNAGNVKFVNHDKDEIINQLKIDIFDTEKRNLLKKNKYFYGDGNSSQKIIDEILRINLDDKKWHIKGKLC